MLFLLIIILCTYLFLKGFFEYILPLLIFLFFAKLFLGGLLLFFNTHFLFSLAIIAFFIWLISTVKKQNY
ncbi:MAG TPA: hypothetical protein DCZ00_03980 [Lactococcus sp.]|nr:hypothetical protein [Lactococcus sp.]HBC90588.1 hypothetical protein [Lactococcus sp.]